MPSKRNKKKALRKAEAEKRQEDQEESGGIKEEDEGEEGMVAQARSPDNDESDEGMVARARSPVVPDSDDEEEGAETQKELQSSLKSLTVSDKIMARPDKGGKKGTKEELLANHFELKFKEFTVAQYDVDVVRLGQPRINTGVKKESEMRGIPIRKREENYTVFLEFARQNPEIFGHGEAALSRLIYDGSKLLFCKPPLNKVPQISKGDRSRSNKKGKVVLTICGRITEGDMRKRNETNYKMVIQYSCDVLIGQLQAAYHDDQFKRNREALQVIDLILRKQFYFNDQFTIFGRSLYDPTDTLDLGCGRQMLKGFYQSVNVVSGWKITLNVDLVASGFYKPQTVKKVKNYQNCVHFIRDFLGLRDPLPSKLTSEQVVKVQKEMKGLKLKTVHLGFGFGGTKVTDGSKNAKTHRFILEKEGSQKREVTIEQYYNETYPDYCPLKYPEWPMVTRGTGSNAKYFPMEMVQLVLQRIPNKKLTDQDHTKIIKETAIEPSQRMAGIKGMLDKAKHNEDDTVQQYRLNISMKFKEVPGRVFQPPQLEYGNRLKQPHDGSWNMDQLRVKQAANPVTKMAVLVVGDSRGSSGGGGRGGRGRGGGFGHSSGSLDVDQARQFIELLRKAANEVGLSLAAPVYVGKTNESNLEREFGRVVAIEGLQYLIVIVPIKSSQLYGLIKFLGDHRYDIATQVIQESNVNRVLMSPQREASLLSNLCLKMNAKLGGVNSQLADGHGPEKLVTKLFPLSNTPIILFGVDVTHPDPGDKRSPSIAAIVASFDQRPRFCAVELVMKHRVEILPINELKIIAKEMLIKYYRQSRMKPKQIIYYRDGVSDGQFQEVMTQELCGLQQACLDLDKDYKPQITFIVVQKRHHTQLFKKNLPPVPMGRKVRCSERNIKAGTTVDSEIVHPKEFDFFICSHTGIQGTSKPTHYHVLHDDHGYTSDDLQILTYYLCHVYARCTKSVSLPAPVYYAHLIAFRARYRLIGSGFDSHSVSGTESERELTDEELLSLAKQIEVSEQTKKTMYWQ